MKFLVVTALAACGGSGGEIAIADFRTAYTDALCSELVHCDIAADLAACKAIIGAQDFELTTVLADVQAGTVKYDGAAAQACLETYAAQCSFPGLHNPEDNPCGQMFVGTVAQGGACSYYEECAAFAECTPTDASCDPNTACCPGTCGAPALAKAQVGDACSGNYDCVEDAYCDRPIQSKPDGTCTPVATHPGDACSNLYACANPMLCTVDNGFGGTCYLPGDQGGACDPNFELGSDLACVDRRSYCDASTKKCVPRVAIGGACSAAVLCQELATCQSGTCVENGAIGAACDTGRGIDCQYGLVCYSGACEAEPTGHACP